MSEKLTLWLQNQDKINEAAILMAGVRRFPNSIKRLTDEQRTPEVCLAAVQQDGYAIQYLTDAQCAQPHVAEWIEANWDACVSAIGQGCAAKVAQAILAARQDKANPPHVRAR